MAKSRKKSDGDTEVPVLREVVDRALVEARAKRLPNLDLFADPASGIPDPNALQHELANRLEKRVEELARQVMRDAERKLADRLKHELPALIEQTLKDHFQKK
jgi:hypothetical protein